MSVNEEILAEMIGDLQAQVTALTSTVRCLIETHPDRKAVDKVLHRTYLRLDASTNASTVPDRVTSTMLALLSEMRVIAQREPKDQI